MSTAKTPDPLALLDSAGFIGGGDIPAVVNGILYRRSGSVELEVIWWDGRTRKCEWVSPAEFQDKPA